MKKSLTTIAIVIIAGMFFTSHAFSMDMDHGKSNEQIHMSQVKGFSLSYKLIDMTEKIKKLEDKHAAHAAMMGSHHLMVYIKPADKQNMKVGFLLTDPEGMKHKVMAMGMGDGFGADLPMMKKGNYTIKTKVVTGNTNFTDEFTYHMK